MKEISAALVKAQKEFGPALKTSTNPHFRSRYADLSACVEAVIDALNNNGIMLMQPTHLCESGVIVETIFLHESGEQISGGKLHVPASKNDAQGYGSALSYARRYSLMASCGIAPEDDDGNAATSSAPKAAPAPKRELEFKKDMPKPEPKAEAPKSDKMKGWEIKVEADDEAKWAEMVVAATNLALQAAKSPEDVQSIFQVNRATYNQMKEKFSGMYDDLLITFKQAKESF
jgi:hypothetical protein